MEWTLLACPTLLYERRALVSLRLRHRRLEEKILTSLSTPWMGQAGLDPAFDCHVLPLKHWALAWWEGWFTPLVLEEAFQAAQRRLADARSPWRIVTGPVFALIASMHRLGWTLPSAREAIDDLGASWSLMLDCPTGIAQACRRSVRRWRLARVVQALPSLQPESCDVGTDNVSESTILVDFAGPLQGLLHRRTVKVTSVPQWSPCMKADLASAVSGGQWPQARRASVKRWQNADNRCQLCLAEPGTLEHRLACTCTMPPEGWPRDPPKAELAIQRVGQIRAKTLRTRGLLVLRLPSPQPLREGWFKWLVAPGPESDELCTWYLDGSMHDGDWVDYRAAGFGIVVVAPDRSLLAYGLGVPPGWCKTAAAAEAWALHIALLESAFPPKLRTDCLSLLSTAQEGATQATGPAKPLACSSVRACMRSADCPPDPVDDLMQLHMDGLKVVWPRSVSAGSESGQLCRDTVPDQTSTCPVGQLAVPKVSTSLSNWPSISQQGPAVARSELEDAEADLALLSKGGFSVIWPRDRIGPRSAGGPGAD